MTKTPIIRNNPFLNPGSNKSTNTVPTKRQSKIKVKYSNN